MVYLARVKYMLNVHNYSQKFDLYIMMYNKTNEKLIVY